MVVSLALLSVYCGIGVATPTQVSYIPADSTGSVTLLFRVDESILDESYMDNARNLQILRSIPSPSDSLSHIENITVTVTSSPEGDRVGNDTLLAGRTELVEELVRSIFPDVDPGRVKVTSQGGGWARVRSRIESDPSLPYYADVLSVLYDPRLTDEARGLKIKTMNGGKTFEDLQRHILPGMRGAMVSVTTRRLIPVVEELPEPPAPVVPAPQPQAAAVYPFALRTNLLTYIAGMPNIGVEVPFSEGMRFSAAADIAFAYWRVNNTYALQTLQGGVEAKYWFRNIDRPLTGWNAGVYGMRGSRYDAQWGGGYQGDGYWSAGVIGGYVMPLKNDFLLGFSLGGGVWYTPEVRRYARPENGYLPWLETRYNVTRFSLTKARVELIWMLGRKEKGERRKGK